MNRRRTPTQDPSTDNKFRPSSLTPSFVVATRHDTARAGGVCKMLCWFVKGSAKPPTHAVPWIVAVSHFLEESFPSRTATNRQELNWLRDQEELVLDHPIQEHVTDHADESSELHDAEHRIQHEDPDADDGCDRDICHATSAREIAQHASGHAQVR